MFLKYSRRSIREEVSSQKVQSKGGNLVKQKTLWLEKPIPVYIPLMTKTFYAINWTWKFREILFIQITDILIPTCGILLTV